MSNFMLSKGMTVAIPALALLTIVLFGCEADRPSNSASDPINEKVTAGAVTAPRVLDVQQAAHNWLVGGGNFEKWHFSRLDQINRKTVVGLRPAWSLEIDSPVGLIAEPIVVDGVAYLSAPLSVVYAVDARTGSLLWTFKPEIDLSVSLGSSYSARINRGVAVWDGLVYVGAGDCRMIAVDAATGDQVWDTAVCDPKEGFGAGITAAPRVGANMIFTGYMGSETGVRGSLVALDAKDGHEIWRFWTVPGNPAGGFKNEAMERASKTWANGWPPMGGGVVWDGITYDSISNKVFFGTAGSIPYAYSQRESRGGDNLYTNSIVAVDADTGDYAWHYQTVPQDTWDYDACMPIMVADLDIGGKQRRVVMQVPKNGFFYLLDAATGELLSADPIAPVSWASHVDMKTGRPVPNPEARYYDFPDRKTRVFPGVTGAHNWQAMSFNPDTGLVYIPANVLGSYWGIREDGSGWYDMSSFDDDGKVIENLGRLIAWDPVKKEPAWEVTLQQAHNGGTLATAGGLVFMGETTGAFAAYDAFTGERLWRIQTGSSISGNPVTVDLDGEQYILVSGGQGSALTLGSAELTATGASKGGPSQLMAFKLNGKGTLVKSESRPAPVPLPYRLPVAEKVKEGKTLWKASFCSACHGARVTGVGRRALDGGVPDLRYAPAAVHEQWLGILMGARTDKGMPGFHELLNVDQAKSIQEYVLSRAWDHYCEQREKELTKAHDFCRKRQQHND